MFAYSYVEKSLNGALLNNSYYTLVTDCLQSVKLGVSNNDLDQQSVWEKQDLD